MAEKLYCEFCGGSDDQCSECAKEQAARERAGEESAYYAHKAMRRLDTAFHAVAVCAILTACGVFLVCLGCVFSTDPPPPTATVGGKP